MGLAGLDYPGLVLRSTSGFQESRGTQSFLRTKPGTGMLSFLSHFNPQEQGQTLSLYGKSYKVTLETLREA